MPERNEQVTVGTGPELTLTRIISAPRELVFEAWSDPKHLRVWWGPKGFTNPVCEWEFRVGGNIRVDMRGPDGTVYPMGGKYLEIVKPERLVFTTYALDKSGKPLFEELNTVTFVAQGNKTKLILSAVVSKVKPEAAPHLAGMNQGWNESLDRMETYVSKL